MQRYVVVNHDLIAENSMFSSGCIVQGYFSEANRQQQNYSRVVYRIF